MQDENKSINTLTSPPMRKTVQYDIYSASTSSSGQNSPSLSSMSSRKRKISEETNASKCKIQYTEYFDKFESFLMEQVKQPLSEVAIFCNFLKIRLEKLDQRYYLEATHNILNELIRLETQMEGEK